MYTYCIHCRAEDLAGSRLWSPNPYQYHLRNEAHTRMSDAFATCSCVERIGQALHHNRDLGAESEGTILDI